MALATDPVDGSLFTGGSPLWTIIRARPVEGEREGAKLAKKKEMQARDSTRLG
jgi:hypothetical protein